MRPEANVDESDGEGQWAKLKEGQIRRARSKLGEAEADAIVEEFNKLKKEPAKQDALILSVLTRNILTDTQTRTLFGVGNRRMDRIREAHPAAPRVAGKYSSEQTSHLVDYVNQIKSEAGFACAHRDQREYLRAGVCLSVL